MSRIFLVPVTPTTNLIILDSYANLIELLETPPFRGVLSFPEPGYDHIYVCLRGNALKMNTTRFYPGAEIVFNTSTKWIIVDFDTNNTLLEGSGTDREDAWQNALRAKNYLHNLGPRASAPNLRKL